MPTLAHTLVDVTGRPIRDALITVRAAAPNGGDAPDHRITTGATIAFTRTVRTGADGTWTLELEGGWHELTISFGSTSLTPVAFLMPTAAGAYSLHDVAFPPPPVQDQRTYGQMLGFSGGTGFMLRAQSDWVGWQADLDWIVSLGYSWVVFNYDWPWVEASEGNPNWVLFDDMIDELRERGLKPVPVALGSPAWANDASQTGFWFPNAGHLADWGAYVAHLAAAGDALIVWNEPNTDTFSRAGVDPAAYGQLCVDTEPYVRAANPDCEIVVGVTSPGGGASLPVTFLDACFDVAGFVDCYDHLAHHPYQMHPVYGPIYEATWNSCFQTRDIWAMQLTKGRQADIWLTEFGAVTGGTTGPYEVVSEARAREIMWEYHLAFFQMEREGVRLGPRCHYSVRDNGPLTSPNKEDHFGALRLDGTEKPQAEVLRSIAPIPWQTPVLVASGRCDLAGGATAVPAQTPTVSNGRAHGALGASATFAWSAPPAEAGIVYGGCPTSYHPAAPMGPGPAAASTNQAKVTETLTRIAPHVWRCFDGQQGTTTGLPTTFTNCSTADLVHAQVPLGYPIIYSGKPIVDRALTQTELYNFLRTFPKTRKWVFVLHHEADNNGWQSNSARMAWWHALQSTLIDTVQQLRAEGWDCYSATILTAYLLNPTQPLGDPDAFLVKAGSNGHAESVDYLGWDVYPRTNLNETTTLQWPWTQDYNAAKSMEWFAGEYGLWADRYTDAAGRDYSQAGVNLAQIDTKLQTKLANDIDSLLTRAGTGGRTLPLWVCMYYFNLQHFNTLDRFPNVLADWNTLTAGGSL